MNKQRAILSLGCLLVLITSGCAVRTYPVARERVDQELRAGNRGYIFGDYEASREEERKETRQLQVIEIELRPSLFQRRGKSSELGYPGPSEPKQEAGDFITTPEGELVAVGSSLESSKAVVMKRYTVKKGDTLNSISKKFYGTSRRWREIYEVNKEILSAPDKIYPGQIIEIPIEELTGRK